jgi:hypothetical protein
MDEKRRRDGEWRIPSESSMQGELSPIGVVAIKEKALAYENNRRAKGTCQIAKKFKTGWQNTCFVEKLNKSGFRT